MDIGGADFCFVGIENPDDAFKFVAKIIKANWPEVVEEGEFGDRFFYKNHEAFELWEKFGAGEKEEDAWTHDMIHLIRGDSSLTVVVSHRQHPVILDIWQVLHADRERFGDFECIGLFGEPLVFSGGEMKSLWSPSFIRYKMCKEQLSVIGKNSEIRNSLISTMKTLLAEMTEEELCLAEKLCYYE